MENLQKFQLKEKVVYKNKVMFVKAASKNFITKQIRYVLADEFDKTNSELIDESKIEKFFEKKAQPEVKDDVETATKKYEKLFSKKVPPVKRKDFDWIMKKIQEKKESSYSIISKLTRVQLEKLVEDKNLDIIPDDYTDEDLLTAICQELGIEIE